MKSIIFATYVTTQEWYDLCAIPLQKSFKYFHPNIPFKIFDAKETNAIFRENNVTIRDGKSYLASTLWDKYEQIVLLDADQIITDTLDEVFTQTCQLAGVHNASDHGSVHCVSPLWFWIPEKVTVMQYMNGGFVSIRGKKVWQQWMERNRGPQPGDVEQGTMNMLGYEYGITSELLDPIDGNAYYGVANSWGVNSPWESWHNIELIYNKLYLKNKFGVNKKIKVLHKAGVGCIAPCGTKFPANLFKSEVYDYLKRVWA